MDTPASANPPLPAAATAAAAADDTTLFVSVVGKVVLTAVIVTVVVVTYGELDQLERSLDALVRQDLQADYEIIVVDNDPAAATARMVALWAARSASHGAQLRYMAHEARPRDEAAARNLGWRAARADIVAFTSDDTVPAPDWLRQGLAAFDGVQAGAAAPGAAVNTSVDAAVDGAVEAEVDVAVGAAVDPAVHAFVDAAVDAAVEAAVEAVFGKVNATLPRHPSECQLKAQLRESGDFAGCNWFATRKLLERLQGFDERFGDTASVDTDMHFRLMDTKARVVAAPAAQVSHPLPPLHWAASLSQLRALSGEALLYKKHRQRYRQTIGQPPDWHDVVVVASLLLAAFGLWLGHELLAVTAGGFWLVLTAMLSIRRLRDTPKKSSHIAAVLVTSLFMPPLALFWRLVGALKHRVPYA
jgi:cellulose synthase/poly-beta-1,6-N-acetylglucosamine synthase-like glycosyltransferase